MNNVSLQVIMGQQSSCGGGQMIIWVSQPLGEGVATEKDYLTLSVLSSEKGF